MPSRRDRLRTELNRLRTLAGMSGRAMATRLGVTQATVSRIELGETLPSMPAVRAWLDATQADEPTRERLLDLTEAVHTETRKWDEVLGDVGHAQRDAQRHEAGAKAVRNFQPTVVPGLLQTPEYARAIMSIGRTKDVEAGVATRVERQQVLYDDTRRFTFLVTENVLFWPVGGPDVIQAQRDRLLSLSRLGTVELAVVPDEVAVAAPWHNFVIYEPGDGPSHVTTELVHGSQEIVDAELVALYTVLWGKLWGAAAHGDEALRLIRETV